MANINSTLIQPKSAVQPLLVAGALALLAAGVFYGIASLHGHEGYAAPPGLTFLSYLPQFDASAETMEPNQFYPFLLAAAHRAGVKGPALLEVAFALNTVFFVFFAISLYIALKPIATTTAASIVLLVLLNGAVASSVMELGDTGLFIALLAALLATLIHNRPYTPLVTALLLGLAGWTRPEGLLMALSIFATGLLLRVRHVFGSTRWIVAGIVGFLLGSTLLTRGWTSPGEVSAILPLIRETHFSIYPFTGALAETSRRLALAVRDAFFNMPGTEGGRFFLPLFGGSLALIGVCSLEWRTDLPRAPLAAFPLALLVAVVIGATQYDGAMWLRQSLAAILPFWIAAAGVGAQKLAEVLPMRRSVYPVLLGVLIAYELFTYPKFCTQYAASCDHAQSTVNFVQTVYAEQSRDGSIGMLECAGLGYFMPDRNIIRVNNIIRKSHPPLRYPALVLETFKRNQHLRFDYWLIPISKTNSPIVLPALGELVALDERSPIPSARWALFGTDWDPFENTSQPLAHETQESIKGLRLVARLNVGDPNDESQHAYRIISRIPGTRLGPFVTIRKCGDPTVFEAGDVILGAAKFTLTVIPFRPLYIVARTANLAEVLVAQCDGIYTRETFHFCSPLILRPVVNGRALAEFPFQMPQDLDAFAELVLQIPADYVDADRLEIELAGDHIAFAYWFYQ